MPTFCRHSRLIQNCPICSREQSVEMRPIVSSPAPRSTEPRRRAGAGSGAQGGGRGSSAGLRVRHLERGADDGYRSSLATGIKSSQDAERLAEELAFAATRLERLESGPPGLYGEVAGGGDIEERTWLAFLIAYIGPSEGPDPFAAIEAVRTSWASGEVPDPEAIVPGPRSPHDPGRGVRTLEAYRAWAQRSGSQAAAFGGEEAWPSERRFARAFERLALPGLDRAARFELLSSLGRLGVYGLAAGALQLGGADAVTLAAKRVFGIGDSLLLERRAATLAEAAGVRLEALDLALYNWERGERVSVGVPDLEPGEDALAGARAALEV